MKLEQLIQVLGPNGSWKIKLKEDKRKLTVGRDDDRDIVLNDKNISRLHCVLEKGEGDYWWVSDNTSTNGTFLQRGEKQIDIKQEGSQRLYHGDVILIPSKSIEGQPTRWELVFEEIGEATEKVVQPSASSFSSDRLEYSLSQQILFRTQSGKRERIPLTQNEGKMIRYMLQQNQKNEGRAVMCDYESLFMAIWGDSDRDKTEVNRLAFELRKKFELDPQNPIFLETVWGDGYRLNVTVIK
ncbi:MAG: FHA domain-containing protein [Okeania sp. SIO2H7]|nr:FHA domain-containing protein [Okeania sp. SIO2H7]